MLNIIRKNEIYETVIENYASDASGICHVNGMTVFVPGSLSGEKLKIRIVKVLSSYCYGRIEEIIEASPERRVPSCPVYKKCGGCSTQHMSYEEELRFKSGIVYDSMLHIAHIDIPCPVIAGSELQLSYRNKATYSFADINGKTVSGFYRDRSHDVIPIDICCIQAEVSSAISSVLTEILNRYGFSAYNESDHSGYIRHLFIRTAHITGEVIICITSARGFGSKTHLIVDELVSSFPEIAGIILNIDKEPGNKLLKGDFYTLWGNDFITDELCGLKFRISPLSFYQINSPQAEKLYDKVREYALVNNDDCVLDLYCGIGTISLYLARYTKKVLGVEIVEQAVENARSNAELNGIENAGFFCSDAARFKEYTDSTGFKPNCIVVDPPRKGLEKTTIIDICKYEPERIVYVSCNPATLARDISEFRECGFELKDLMAFDMFPRTSHVETVVLMSRTV